jgi:hypothetical protein
MALTNVAEMVEGRTQRRMLEEGVLKPLQKLAASPLVDVRREVARAFALFASKRDSHQDILQCGGLQQMVSFLRSDDPKCERFGALGIANLGTAAFLFDKYPCSLAPNFLCISCAFPVHFLCISCAFPVHFLCISCAFPVHFLCIS